MKELLFFLVLSVAAISLAAQVTLQVPLGGSNIPITGQSLAVLLVGFFLHRIWGTVAVLLYLLLGAFGMPIFADGHSGCAVLKGGSGGFLIGFLFGAFITGWWSSRKWKPNLAECLIAMLLGTTAILLCGLARLTYLFGWEKALEYGFFPFWEAAFIKIFLGVLIAYLAVLIFRKGEN